MLVRRRRLVVKLLHLDDSLVVVDKPAGVLSVPGRGSAPSIADLLAAQRLIPAGELPRVVHRLDRGASGVMVLGRTPDAQRRLCELFAKRKVDKVYLVLVQGFVAADGEVRLPLRVNRDKLRVEVAKRNGKAARTAYRILERVVGHTLLECRPMTGRLHQIRVHLAAIGHPLAVDPKYGGGRAIFLSSYKAGYRPSRRRKERPLIARLTLHAARLAFQHPGSTAEVTFESPLPKDFQAALNQLRRL